MDANNEQPLHVATIGMDERSRRALESAFQGPGGGAFVVVDGSTADVTIVDLDRPDAQQLWTEHRAQYPGRPEIVLSLTERQAGNAFFLRKPLQITVLLQALQQIQLEIAAGVYGDALERTSGEATPEAPGARPSPPAVAHGDAAAVVSRRSDRSASVTREAARALEKREISAGYSSSVAEVSDLDIADPEQLARLYYREEDYAAGTVLGMVKTSLEDQVPRDIKFRYGRIVTLPATREVVTDLSDARLKQFGLVRVAGANIDRPDGLSFELDVEAIHDERELTRLEQRAPPNTVRSAAESFIWKLAAWVSRGRVPEHTDLSHPVVMRHWPNMTRLLLTPNALRIAALWAEPQPRSLLNTAQALQIPLSHVLTFYSAANAVGLITSAKRQVDFLFQPEPLPSNQERSLMKRIVARLRGTT